MPRDVLTALVDALAGGGGHGPPPPPDDHKVLRVDVRGTKDGQVLDYRLESVQHPYPAWGMSCGAFTVGFLSAVTALLLGRGSHRQSAARSAARRASRRSRTSPSATAVTSTWTCAGLLVLRGR